MSKLQSKKQSPKFKVGDIVWYISEWDEFDTPTKGKITKVHEEDEEITVNSIYDNVDNPEYVYIDDQHVSRTKKETLKKSLKSQIECTKDSILRQKQELLGLQIKLAKIT